MADPDLDRMRKPNREGKLRYRERRRVDRMVGLLCWGRALSNFGIFPPSFVVGRQHRHNHLGQDRNG